MKRFSRHPDELTLSLMAGGDLAPLARLRVASHVKRCEACRGTVASYARMRKDIADKSVAPVVDFAALSHKAAVEAEQQRERIGVPAGWQRKAAYATSGAVALALALVLSFPDDESSGQAPDERVGHVAGAVQSPAQDAEPVMAPLEGTDAQVTADGSLSVRSYDQATGTLTITDYFAP